MTQLLPENFTKKNTFNRWEVLRQILRIINFISKSKKYVHKHVTKFLVQNYYSFLDVRALRWIRNCTAIESVPKSASHSTDTKIAYCFNKFYSVYSLNTRSGGPPVSTNMITNGLRSFWAQSRNKFGYPPTA
jgi:hypothetical protein